MAKIGFRNKTIAEQELPVLYNEKKAKERVKEGSVDADTIIKIRGWQIAIDFLEQYLDLKNRPFLVGVERDDWFKEKISQVRLRYFEEIK